MRRRLALVLVVVLVAAGVGGGWWWTRHEADRDAAARAALMTYADGWRTRDLTHVPFAAKGAAADFEKAVAGLKDATVAVDTAGVRREGDVATADLDITWTLPGDVEWSYTTPVRLLERDGRWLVAGPGDGSPWHPDLAPGETMRTEHTAAPRGDLLDRSGDPLMPEGTVYRIELDPVRADAADAAAVEKVTGVTSGSVVKALAARTKSGSQAPIPVITYREADYTERKKALDAITGVLAVEGTQPLAPTRGFGQPLLGTVGEVTAEMIEKSDGAYSVGDVAGRSGLQAQYDARLGGTPGESVVTSDGTTLFSRDPVAGEDVTTTLDPRVQKAAESALDAARLDAPGALVAVDVPTGEVLAAANSPSSGFDRAITGRYPPGSTFKIATTYAYLTNGVTTPDSTVPCPTNVVVDGRSFHNYAGESIPGAVPFSQDFAHSCNTAFISLSQKLGTTDLRTAAKALGIGAGWADTLGVAGAFDGSIPETRKGTDQAAAVIGQGRDEVSPLALAVMSGSIARGTYAPPELVTSGEGGPRPTPLDGRAVGQIRSMMAQVVTSGTATVMRDTPGGTVRGKTGTADHGVDEKPYTWFTGYQGDVAYAVLVEAGVSGGQTAAPVAKRFLTTLARS